MGTAIGRVIDYFVAGLPDVLAAIDTTARVWDNWPAETGASQLVIGHESYESGQAADSDAAWYDIGGQRIEETFTVPCFIDVHREGPNQKPARDAAIALFDGVVAFIATDPTLGGVLERGRVAIASHVRIRQTEDSDDTGSGGLRRAEISFHLACKNAYRPL